MDISIVIINRNCQSFLKRCIDSLFTLRSNLDSEIIVIDNASQDKSVEFLEKNFPQVKLICNKNNLGYAKACNQGIKEAKSKYIFILNPDTGLLRGSLDEMLRFMEENPRCGILGPKLLDEDGKIQFSCRAFPTYSTAFFNRYSLLTRLFPHSKYANRYLKTNWPHDNIQEVDWVSGAAMLIRRDCLDQIGKFDEEFFMYCEDVDICKRAKDKGWQIFYYPKLSFIHFIGRASGRTSFLTILWHHQSMWHYYIKHLKVNMIWDAFIFIVIFMRFISQIYLRLIKKIFIF